MYEMDQTYNNEVQENQSHLGDGAPQARAPCVSLPLSEFRANAAAAIALVEQGATVRLLRHGKPVADLVPVCTGDASASASPALGNFTPAMGSINGRKTIQALLAERNRDPW